jgi:hypothetical protein
MTAHRQKPTITPERVAWFTRFYQRKGNGAWGYTFHVTLDDCNWDSVARADARDWPDFDELKEQVAWFNSLTDSQRKRLRAKVDQLDYQQNPPPPPVSGSYVVTKIDRSAGTITLAHVPEGKR